VRAFLSETASVITMNGSRFRVLEASVQLEQMDAAEGAPGTISEITKAGVKILGTDGYLLVTALQIPNAKGSVMRYGELKNLSAFGIKVGARFDSLSGN
jgi:methionyl-tRNA formyltransferase